MTKPAVEFPEGEPTGELQVRDLVVGEGEQAKAGQQAVVHYVGIAHSTRKEFDASYNRGAPFTFGLGDGQVIAGWDQGVQGMRIGGRRELIIPPHLGYGDRGAGGAIRGGETLIFVVDLLELR
ncbi:MAG TPA: FKBP-type peptidyl-prolyl cis-trans isomerase [Jatrophihabitans sp.]